MRFFFCLCLLSLLAACDSGQVPEERSYIRTVIRESDTDEEAALIAEAEAAYPSRDDVLAAAPDPSLVPADAYWFYDIIDGARIPYAITNNAIAYYAELVDALGRGEGPRTLLATELDYRATISFQESYLFEGLDPETGEPLAPEAFENVYVVEMTLDWFQYCGPVCGLQFDRTRTVVFDADGVLLRVFGDGSIPVAIS